MTDTPDFVSANAQMGYVPEPDEVEQGSSPDLRVIVCAALGTHRDTRFRYTLSLRRATPLALLAVLGQVFGRSWLALKFVGHEIKVRTFGRPGFRAAGFVVRKNARPSTTKNSAAFKSIRIEGGVFSD